jgi:hypothetical protein
MICRFGNLRVMNRRGFGQVTIILIVVLVAVVAVGIWYFQSHQSTFSSPPPSSQVSQTSSPSNVATVTLPPTLANINPLSGPLGTRVTLTGTGFSSSNDVLIFDYNDLWVVASGVVASNNGTSLTFTMPGEAPDFATPSEAAAHAACANCAQGVTISVGTGTYQVAVESDVNNASDTSNELPFTVTGGNNLGQ